MFEGMDLFFESLEEYFNNMVFCGVFCIVFAGKIKDNCCEKRYFIQN